MKHLISTLLILFFFVGCEKDEPMTDTQVENAIIENRTGQHETVFFDRSGAFASTSSLDSIQSIINLKHVDSIRYVADWNAPFIYYLSTQLAEYNIKFYEAGNLVYQTKVFAKWRAYNYRQIIGQLEGWDSDVFMMHAIRTSGNDIEYFDHECLKSKLEHQYIIKVKYHDGTSANEVKHIRSNVCNRNQFFYSKSFKQ
jgi:hypothetical protein